MNVLNECRVCFETTDQNLMVSPCVCRGSMAYIHFQCLKNCIETSGQQKCGICGQNWLGIEFVKKRNSFANFLKEQKSMKFDFFYSLFAIMLTILALILHTQFGSTRIEFNLISLAYYSTYSIVILTNLAGIYNLFSIINDYQIWVKFNLKYTIIEC